MIREKNLLANQPGLAASYNNIGTVYKNMGEYSKALLYLERAFDCWQRSLPSSHPDLEMVKRSTEFAKQKP
jgi:tetratricopeptide (TPR) repeat protein